LNAVSNPLVIAAVNLSLLPASNAVTVGSMFDLTIQADAGATGVAGVDAFLNFDPAKLAVVDMDAVAPGIQITPGAALNTVMTNSCNNSAGQIDYSAGTLSIPYPSGNFTVAIIRFLALAATPTTNVTFSTTGARQTSITESINDVTGTLTGATVAIKLDAPITFNPVSISPVYVGQTFSLEIKTNTGATQEVSGVSSFINFDATKLEVMDDDATAAGVQITPGTSLPTVLVNNADNAAGTIDFSAGKLGTPYPTGAFLVATIHFKAKAISTPTTPVTFAFSGVRETMVQLAGTGIPGTHVDATVQIFPGAIVDIAVVLQGGSRLDSGWIVPLTVKFFNPGADVMTATPVYTFNLTTAKAGGTAVAQCAGVIPGNYDITAVSEHTLLNVKRNIAIISPSSSVNLGTLLEGNANNNDRVNIQDFGLLSASYSKLAGDPGYNAMADFDRNGRVNIQDFGLLSANYMKISPIEVP
jgi:hypothetical protein